jgi:hypothetical protein
MACVAGNMTFPFAALRTARAVATLRCRHTTELPRGTGQLRSAKLHALLTSNGPGQADMQLDLH